MDIVKAHMARPGLRILLVLNKPNREIPIMEAIRREVLALAPDARVELHELVRPDFNAFVLRFRPHVILTYPFTCVGFSRWFYVFKLLLRCRVVCLRAEGVVDLSSQRSIDWATGYDTYGPGLVDAELFWGPRVAAVIGANLVRQGKLSGLERVRSVGYVRLESYFDPGVKPRALPGAIERFLDGAPRGRTALFITGFHMANYTRADLLRAADLDAEHRLDELLGWVEATKRLRASWIQMVRQVALDNPDLRLLLKKHPIEQASDYDALAGLQNLTFVHQDIEIQDLVGRCGLFLHYGSTAAVDAYLSRIPTVLIESDDWRAAGFSDLGWPATYRCDVAEVPAFVARHARTPMPFETSADVARVLHDVFSIEPGRPYRPAAEIAAILVSDERVASPVNDPWFWRAVLTQPARSMQGRARRLVAWLREGRWGERREEHHEVLAGRPGLDGETTYPLPAGARRA